MEPDEKNQYIEKIYKSHILQDIIKNIGKNDSDLKDLEQDMWLDLATKKDTELLKRLAENENECKYYFARMICNQIKSSTSDYTRNYKKWERNKNQLKPNEETERTIRRLQDR